MRLHALPTGLLLVSTAQGLRFGDGVARIVEARDIDPTAGIDPTRASVASVLRTAIPAADQSSLLAGPNPTLAPGEDAPAWYLNLPADVKSLLPVLYPVSEVHDAGVITSIASSTSWCSTSTTTRTITLTRVPVTGETESCTTTTTTSTSTTTRTMTLTVGPSASSSSSAPSETEGGELSSACSSTTTLTKTMTLTFTETSQATSLSGTETQVSSLASLTSTATDAVFTTGPFPFINATASVAPINGTSAGLPSQTSGSAPEQFTNAAVARAGGLDMAALVGMGAALGLLL